MNADWRIERLGDVCTFDKAQGIHTDLPYVGLENIESGTGQFEGSMDPVSVKSATFRFTKSHVLYGRLRPYLNKVLLPDFDGHCSTEIFPIKPGGGVSREYLFHWLSMDTTVKAIDATCTGARMPRANMNAVLDFSLPIPPLAEQHRIVAILDKAFEGIATARANAEKNLQKSRTFLSTVMRATLDTASPDWIETTIGDQVTLQRGFDITKDQQRPGSVPVVSSGGIRSHHDTAMVKAPGVVMGRKGTLGKVFYLEEDFWPHDTSLWVKDFKENDPRFVYRFFEALDVQHLDSGAANPALNRNQVHALATKWPPYKEQAWIANRMDALTDEVHRLTAIFESKLAALEELKKSLLHQAFTGELSKPHPISVTRQPTVQTATPEFTANVISLAHARHERLKREKTFGRVKEQKTLHLVEAIAEIDLGRQPMRDAAGPNDFQHMLKAEEWAQAHGFFEMVKTGEGYEFRKLSKFDEHMSHARQTLAPYLSRLEPVIDLLVPLDKEEAEVFATVHAAWNNLLIDGVQATDDAIVLAARQDWHPDKLTIQEHKFRIAIETIRQKKLVPTGSAKYVGGQKALFEES